MFIPTYIENLGEVSDYANGRLLYYIGTEIGIDRGIKNFFDNLSMHGQILVGEVEMVDYLYGSDIIQVLLYKSLGKLEYLEYLWEKSVDNNAK